jgi:hypothetical protein
MPRFPPASLTQHARQRLTERFRITEDAFLWLLNANLGVRLGVSTETNRLQRLMWSVDDACPLVVIQEVVSGAVLTVLTVDMYRRDYGERLSERRLERALGQLARWGIVLAKHRQNANPRVRVVGYFEELEGGDARPIALGTWDDSDRLVNLEQLNSNRHFWQWVVECVQSRNAPLERLRSVVARFSGSDERVSLTYSVESSLVVNEKPLPTPGRNTEA